MPHIFEAMFTDSGDIIESWRMLFELAPEQFMITGRFLSEEEWYEKILVNKKEIAAMLENWGDLCEKALENSGRLLHNVCRVAARA